MSSKIPNGERGAIEALITAKQSGRKIVPFLGAGISAGSGFPLVEAIRVYLLKVRYFIQYGAYRNALGLPDDSTTPITDPEQNPSRYLTDFGWPNPNQLNSDLYRITAFRPQEKAINTPFAKIGDWKGLLNDPAVVAAQTKLKAKDLSFAMRQAATISKETHWIDCHVAKVFSTLLDAPPTLPVATPLANELSRFVRYLQTTRKSNARWGRRRWRLSSSALFAQLEDIRLYDRRLAEAIEEKVWSLDLAPTTDWARHLMQLSEGNLNLIDALFSMLGLRYAPGLSHRMMAQLVKGLNLPLLLTINFDPYLEQALQEEGISPRVLDVSRDDDPPDVAVVKQALSIIKLHGSSHSIRLGERLDYALDDDTRSRVANFVGDDALLLVVGFSGYERRMMQLIDHLATGPSLSKQPRVLWMHFEPEDELPGTLKDFQRRLRDVGRGELLQTARLADAGEFLFHFYQRAMDSYPRVRVPVTILPKRIIDLPRQEKVTEVSVQHPERLEANTRILDEIPVQFFVAHDVLDCQTDGAASCQWGSMSSLEASVMLSRFAQRKKGYNLIWIDLEEHHTVAGVVTEIIDRMRVFDPDLSPLIQPVEKAEQNVPGGAWQNQDSPHGSQKADDARNEFDKPVRFLHRALRRGRYIIAFDSLEDFGREHTSHHGLPSAFDKQDVEDQNRKTRLIRRVEDLLSFILRLIEGGTINGKSATERVWDLDWYCGVACSMPEPRHDPIDDADKSEGVVQPVVEAIRRFFHVLENDTSHKGGVVSRVPPKGSDISEMSLVGTMIAIIPIYPSEPASSRNISRPVWDQFESIEENTNTGRRHEENSRYRDIQTRITKHIGEFTRRVLSHRFGVSDEKVNDLTTDDHWLMIGSPENNLLPILTLATARRPRSFVGIRNLWCEYLPPDWKMTRAKKTECVTATLDFLEEQSLIRLMPGGFYWMPHRLHRKAYRLLTEPIRKRRVNKLRQQLRQIHESSADAEQVTETVVSSALRLLFVVTIHSRLARFYYLHVFQRTRDANAMFEYLYHRVTSLKYLNLVLSLLHDAATCTREIGDGIIKRIRKSADLLVVIEGQSSNNERDTVYPKAGSTEGSGTEDVWGGLDRLRERLLQAFSNVFEREQEVFLSLGSADTWLAWIEQIKDHDLKDLVGFSESASDAKSMSHSDAALSLADEQAPIEQRARRMARLRDRLKGRLEDLHATLLREKRDWRECVRNRLKHLMAWMRRIAHHVDPNVDGIASKRDTPTIVGAAERLSLAQYLFRLGRQKDEEFLRELLELVRRTAILGASGELDSITAEVVRLLKSGEASLGKWGASDLVEELNRFFGCLEDIARCIHHDRWMSLNGVDLRRLAAGQELPEYLFTFADLMLTGIRSFASIARGESGTQSTSLEAFSRRVRDVMACLDAWEVRIKFERIRLRFERHDLWSRPPAQNDIEEMKRFCTDLEEARHRTRGADTTNPIEFPLRRCQLRTLQASILTVLGRCREARLALAHAETGLTEETLQQRFQLAIVGEFKAQTWMKQADQVLDWFELQKLSQDSTLRRNLWFDPEIWESWRNQFATRDAAWKAVRGNLEDASQVLLTAERLLQSGRRSTGQWLRLYGAKAQIEIENLLLMLFRMDGDQQLSSFGSELHFRAQLNNMLQRGVEAIRGGWDCIQAASCVSSELANRDRSPWLAKWCQLMVTGYMVLERYSLINYVERAHSVSESEKQLDAEAIRDRVDRTYGKLKEIANEQHRISNLDKYGRQWRAINESVGLERFMEADEDGFRWKKLLKTSSHAASLMETEIVSRRQRAKKLIEIMVWEETAADPANAKWSPLRTAYTEWREHRVLPSEVKRS